MPVPTPGREGEAPSLVLQELSTQSDLSASAGLPSAGEAQFPTVRGGANCFAGGHMDAERGAGLVGLPAERIRYCYWVRLGFARGSRCSPSGRWAGWRRSPSAAECIVWHIMTLAIVLGTISAFDMPGRQSLIVRMTSTEDLLHAISMNSAIFNGARVVGGFKYVHEHRAVRTLLGVLGVMGATGSGAVAGTLVFGASFLRVRMVEDFLLIAGGDAADRI